MSLKNNSAENMFRNSFERLKNNEPNILPKDSPITQNNVAREAGRDPSALKKDRYPLLVLEIQAYIKLQQEESSSKIKTRDNRSRSQKQKLEDCIRQRDKLSSIVSAQNSYIQELLSEIKKLKSKKVVSL